VTGRCSAGLLEAKVMEAVGSEISLALWFGRQVSCCGVKIFSFDALLEVGPGRAVPNMWQTLRLEQEPECAELAAVLHMTALWGHRSRLGKDYSQPAPRYIHQIELQSYARTCVLAWALLFACLLLAWPCEPPTIPSYSEIASQILAFFFHLPQTSLSFLQRVDLGLGPS
jgi:hypothetical protein